MTGQTRTYITRGLIAGLLLLTTLSGCGPDTQDARKTFGAALQAEIGENHPPVTDYYSQRDFKPVWVSLDTSLFGSPSTTQALEELIDAVQQADSHGLLQDNYSLDELQALHDAPPALPEAAAAGEWRAMQSYLQYAQDFAQGRYSQASADNAWFIPKPPFDHGSQLRQLDDSGVSDSLHDLLPQTAEYRRLQRARSNIVDIVDAGGWPTVDAEGLIQPGEHHAAIPDLRRRLSISGELDSAEAQGPAAEDPTLYDPQTVAAFTKFQRRHGIADDGIVGQEARQMLNYPASKRLEQIDANLERLRWLPRDLANDRIMVNIAAYWLVAYRDGEPPLNMPVIVGEEQNQTPAFHDTLEFLEINPYWTVPNSIIVKEMAAEAAQNPTYFSERNMVVQADWPLDSEVLDPSDIDWDNYADPDANFPNVVRQLPGPDNALGRIKFMFPNKFSIYLHDTPARHLFEKADRTFSHGCIRVGDPIALAGFVLKNTDGWDAARVEETIESREMTRVDLAEADRLPVYIYYSTAWVDEDDVLYFRPDRYQRDASLMLTLKAGHSPVSSDAISATPDI